ncbi:MAG: methyltransferase domain-containing protein [Tissierellia bacterium]|nr:methyltransferase domain-containing protein [Tissierellia bacterium]
MINSKLLNSIGFDHWAENYDRDVDKSNEMDRYPFAAYDKVIEEVLYRVKASGGKSVLDIGFGTGVLTKSLYDLDFKITGIDFSEEMYKIAREKMPNARLLIHNFQDGLSMEIANEEYDIAICTYAIHHLNYDEQCKFIYEVFENLREDGILVIGDVMTKSRTEMNYAMDIDGEIWDDSEYYIVVEELRNMITKREIEFIKKSYCSGVLIIK